MRENLSEKEYIDLVVSPIADEVQKVETARELEAHIDERTAYYEALGLSEEAARQKAVADMGDPEPVGAKLARLHPKGGIFKKIFYTLLLAVLLLIFWWWEIFSAIDDGIKGIGIIETVLLVYFLALSRAGRRQKSLYLCLLSTIVFALTGFFYLFIKSDVYSNSDGAAVFSPMVVNFFCLLTGDFDGLRILNVGGVTVAPWLSVASFLFYGLIFAALLGSSIYVRKLQKQSYSLFDKKASKGIAALQTGVPIGLAVVLVLSIALMPLGNAPKMPVQGEQKDFDTVIVAQSETPGSWASVAPEDILVLERNYDLFGQYIFSWDEYSFDGSGFSYLQHAHRVEMDDNKKIHYKVDLETLACAPEKPYVCVLFVDDEIYDCEDLSSLPPIEAEDWQETKDGAVYSAVMNNYNCFEVTIYKS